MDGIESRRLNWADLSRTSTPVLYGQAHNAPNSDAIFSTASKLYCHIALFKTRRV